MKVEVLLSSGEEDEWEDVDPAVDMNLGGALVLTSVAGVVAVYAPGMWMRMQIDES